MLLSAFLAATLAVTPAGAATTAACPWESVIAASDLGMSDHNATYLWAWLPVHPDQSIRLTGDFPHARYLSFVLQDQDGVVIDSLDDVDVRPARGPNPFRPGAKRSGPLGGYELRVEPRAAPTAARPPNTLYAGVAADGAPNKLVMLNVRIYLPDEMVSRARGAELWATGGVPAPAIRLMDSRGAQAPCPPTGEARAAWRARQKPTAEQTRGVQAVPGEAAATNPPSWFHSQRKSPGNRATLGPNDNTTYISAPISARYGDLLVFRWRPPQAPIATAKSEPFPARSAVRYWSLSFMYQKPGATDFGGIRTERTIADYQVPVLPDGTAQLVVGLGGRAKPAGLPDEQWAPLAMSEGVVMVREIMPAPNDPADLGLLPRGMVPAHLSHRAPGGTYMTEASLRALLAAQRTSSSGRRAR